MKNKRWLLILIGALFIINISFFVFIRLVRYEDWIISRLNSLIAEHLELQSAIGSITVTDKQLHLADVKVVDPDGIYEINVTNIYVNYNLFKVIFSNLRIFKAVESISIIEPVIKLQIPSANNDNEHKKTGAPFTIPILPDIRDYFQTLSVIDGALTIEYQNGQISYRDHFEDLSLSISNNRTSKLHLKLLRNLDNENGTPASEEDHPTPPVLIIDLETNREEITYFSFLLVGYQPDLLSVEPLSDLYFSLDLQGTYEKHTLKVAGMLYDLSGTYQDKNFHSEWIELFSYDDRLFLHTDNLLLDQNPTLLEMELLDLFSEPEISLHLLTRDIPLEKYLPLLNGKTELEVNIAGPITQPIGRAEFRAKTIRVSNEIVSDVLITGEYTDQIINFNLLAAKWQENLLRGRGSYTSDVGLVMNIVEQGLQIELSGTAIKTDLIADLRYRDKLTVKGHLTGSQIENEVIKLANINLEFNLSDGELEALIRGNRFTASVSGDLQQKRYLSKIDLQGFNLNEIIKPRSSLLKSYPNLTGRIDLSYENEVFQGQSSFNMYNLRYGELQGNLRSDVSIDFLNELTFFAMETTNATYHFEPFVLKLRGSGSLNSFATELFQINQDVKADLRITTEPELQVRLHLIGDNFSLSRYLRYLLPHHTAKHFRGEVDLDIDLNYPDRLQGSVTGKGLSYRKLGPYNNEFSLSFSEIVNNENGINDTIEYSGTITSLQETPLAVIKGKTVLNRDLDTEIEAVIDNLSANMLMSDSELQGIINADLYLSRRARQNEIGVKLTAKNGSYSLFPQENNGRSLNVSRLEIDTLFITARQTDHILYIDEFYAYQEGLYQTNIQGSLGYNVFKNRNYSSDDQMHFSFSGDLIKAMANSIPYLINGSSETEIDLNLGIVQDELAITDGLILISKGDLRVQDQPERATDINLDFTFNSNRMTINRFDTRIGEGRLFIRNEIKDDERDFLFGMLNLGHLYVTTTANGIAFHMPRYFPHASTGNIVIRGRNDLEAEITGPFDDIKVLADINVSRAAVTYPPETENLFKLINVARERRTDRPASPFPVELDVILYAKNQVRYITYPLNLLMVPNSFLHLVHKDGKIVPENAYFTSESGSLDMFGTTFNLQRAEFYINYELNDYRLNGTFTKYASDGSLITLVIFNDPDRSSRDIFETMQFNLKSDNPEDRTALHVLSKLRYNQRLEDIPRAEQNALMQDEFLQLAGIGLSGAFVDPLIYPFISRTKQLFKLDSFSIKPSLVENLIRTYGFTEKSREPEEENEIIQFGKNIILNNLSITMGKLVMKDLFLNYEFLLQRPVDVVGKRDLLLYHNFTFHYNLPHRLRLAYRFYLKPEGEKNSHEIFIRRGFVFW